jgi:hypothetical protein
MDGKVTSCKGLVVEVGLHLQRFSPIYYQSMVEMKAELLGWVD